MGSYRVLVSWIGYADLSGMAEALGEKATARVLAWMGSKELLKRGAGPVRALLAAETFDEVHLLLNYDPSTHKPAEAEWMRRSLSQWLAGTSAPTIHLIELENPTRYKQVFMAADGALARISERLKGRRYTLCIHLSPGTPAMTAIWVLLGKSRYPAVFYQSHEQRGVWVEEIPFDLAVDYVPALLRDPDTTLQNLAARSPKEVQGFEDIAGESKVIRMAVGQAQRAAVRDVPVLLLGESGTGKEMFARAIHAASHRRNGPFEAINCAAIPRELLESELFGHKKGAFTGAVADREGAFERADGGTLFLDEIGECEPAMQVKLLRVLQPPPGGGPCTRRFRRVGDPAERTADVRILAATNQDLLDAVASNRFREDLFYRLAVITIHLPPLRERRSDIPLIAQKLLDQINEQFRHQEPGYREKKFSASALSFLKRHPWPGNVRQLYNAIVRAAVMTEEETIQESDMAGVTEFAASRGPDLLEEPLGEGFSLPGLLERIQRHYLERAMRESDGRITQAARLLGIANYQTLDGQLKRFKLEHLKR